MKTLLVVDGNSILNRAYYGIRPLTTSAGLHTNAVYGMITMLAPQLEKYQPDYCVTAFDLREPTFRHKMSADYKATRKGMPPELAEQLPYAHRAVSALGFSIVERPGYEADDILGTLAAAGGRAGDVRTLILTGDRDSLQLIDANTAVLLATNNDYILYDEAVFREKYGISPAQFVDVKAIMGDSSDNIPGVPGIGEKGALALISRFGSLDAVYNGYTDAGLTPSTVRKLEEGRESAFLSRTLATICREVPDMPGLDGLAYGGLERDAARGLFTELEFSALIKKFRLDTDPAAETDALTEYGAEKIYELLAVPGAAISLSAGALTVCTGQAVCTAPYDGALPAAVAENAAGLVCYDCKSIYEESDRLGVRLRGIGFDVMLAAYVLDPQGGSDIARLVTTYLGEAYSDRIPDAAYVFRLRGCLTDRLNRCNAYSLFADIEMPLAGVLADMEEEGFLIDREGLTGYGAKLEETVSALAERIYFAAGQEFNINSPKQLAEILFEKMKLPAGKKTKSGYSTGAEILEKLAPDYPVVADILEYRQLTKLIGTYVTGLLKVAGEDGRVHTSFKQTGTATGRLSSAEPNLQNIPIRTDAGRELRKFFLPREGCVLIDADYSQIELRLLACISGDEKMMRAFIDGADIHTSTASAVFGVPPDEVTPVLRKRAKAVNFGIVYGIGEFSLAGDLEISLKQARDYIDSYLATYPGVRAYLHDIVEKAKNDGYVETLYGRRRYIPELKGQNAMLRKFGERVAMNSPIQGSAADIIKVAMLGVSRRLRGEGIDARMILQVHDELIVEAGEGCAARAAEILREEMENAIKLPVPLTVDLTVGKRWYET